MTIYVAELLVCATNLFLHFLKLEMKKRIKESTDEFRTKAIFPCWSHCTTQYLLRLILFCLYLFFMIKYLTSRDLPQWCPEYWNKMRLFVQFWVEIGRLHKLCQAEYRCSTICSSSSFTTVWSNWYSVRWRIFYSYSTPSTDESLEQQVSEGERRRQSSNNRYQSKDKDWPQYSLVILQQQTASCLTNRVFLGSTI